MSDAAAPEKILGEKRRGPTLEEALAYLGQSLHALAHELRRANEGRDGHEKLQHQLGDMEQRLLAAIGNSSGGDDQLRAFAQRLESASDELENAIAQATFGAGFHPAQRTQNPPEI